MIRIAAIVTAEHVAAARAQTEALGWGASFNVPLPTDGLGAATAFGLSTMVEEGQAGTLAALAGVVIDDQGGEDPAAQFETLIAAQGLVRVLPPPLE